MHCKLSTQLSNKKQQQYQHCWVFEQLTRTYTRTHISVAMPVRVYVCAWARSNISMPDKKQWELSNINERLEQCTHTHTYVQAPNTSTVQLTLCVVGWQQKMYTQNSFSVGWFCALRYFFSCLLCVVVFWSILCMCATVKESEVYAIEKWSEAKIFTTVLAINKVNFLFYHRIALIECDFRIQKVNCYYWL